jgi:hypothetical protein
MFRSTRKLNDAPVWSAKQLLVLLALLLPCTAPTIGLSAFAVAAECETDCVDIEEWPSTSQAKHPRKNRHRQLIRYERELEVGNHPTLPRHQAVGHFYLGHRLLNGLLAPLQC